MDDPRCLSSAEVVPGVLKRCIRATRHPDGERHLWVEDVNRSDAPPMVVIWDDQRRLTVFELLPMGA